MFVFDSTAMQIDDNVLLFSTMYRLMHAERLYRILLRVSEGVIFRFIL